MKNRYKKLYYKYIILTICLFSLAFVMKCNINKTYKKAVSQYNKGEYELAINNFKKLGDFKETYNYIDKAQKYIDYNTALDYFGKEEYDEAYLIFNKLEDFEDSKEQKVKVLYAKAISLYNKCDYANAEIIFAQIEHYEDSSLYKAQCAIRLVENEKEELYNYAISLTNEKKYKDALDVFNQIEDYRESKALSANCERMIKAKTISAGIPCVIAINKNGRVKIADNDSGFNFDGWENVISISGKGSLVLGLDNTGKTYATAMNGYPYDIDVSSWDDIVEISTGEMFGIGLKADHTIVGIGRNVDGQLNIEDWTNIISIATTYRMSVGLDNEGNLHFAGNHQERFQKLYNNIKSKIGTIVSIDAGGGREKESLGHVLILNDQNQLFMLGDDFENNKMEYLENIKYYSCGNEHLIAISYDNNLICIGKPGTIDYLGQNEKEKMNKWSVDKIVDISAGYSLTVALYDTGEIFAAGNEHEGQMNSNRWTDIKVIERY